MFAGVKLGRSEMNCLTCDKEVQHGVVDSSFSSSNWYCDHCKFEWVVNMFGVMDFYYYDRGLWERVPEGCLGVFWEEVL